MSKTYTVEFANQLSTQIDFNQRRENEDGSVNFLHLVKIVSERLDINNQPIDGISRYVSSLFEINIGDVPHDGNQIAQSIAINLPIFFIRCKEDISGFKP